MHDTNESRVLAGQLADKATAATEALHTINRLTIHRPPIPAPELYRVLGRIEELVDELDQALRQAARCLQHGADVFDIAEDDPLDDPMVSIQTASDRLDDAATHAYRASLQIALARNAIVGQSYRPSEVTR
jgi:hypothetical protein